VTQTIQWRAASTMRKWLGKAECVMSVVTSEKEGVAPTIDIRIRRTTDHASGAGWTKEGVRLSLEDAYNLAESIQHIIDSLERD